MDYEKLVETYEKLDSTTKRLEKTYYVSELLKKTKKENMDKITLLLQGKVYPSADERKIGIASKLIVKALNISTGIDNEKINNKWKKTGDLGETAEQLVDKKTQRTLFQNKLSVDKVFKNIQKLTEIEGKGAVDKKLKLVAELITSASGKEAKFIARTLLEDLRLGVGDGVMRDSIVWAFLPHPYGVFFKCPRCKKVMPNVKSCIYCTEKIENKFKKDFKDKDLEIFDSESEARKKYNEYSGIVQNAYDLTTDFGKVAKIAKEKGINGLKKIKIETNTPLKVMLYQKAKGFEDAFKTVGKPCAIEFKYDGFRVQIHKKDDVKLFTRRLEEVTKQFPDLIENAKFKGKDFIFDAEIIGIDEYGKYLPFQNISQRIRRKYDIEKMAKEIPVVLRIFDVMEYEGKNCLDLPFKERRDILEKAVKENKTVKLAEQKIVDNKEDAEEFFKESLKKGNEGAMMKKLDAPYKPGSRVGYGVKIKDVMETLDLVIVGAEWGTGKRGKWLSSFILACQDDDGNLLEIGKVGTGFKEKSEGLSFKEMTDELKPLIISEKGRTVKVKPKIVLEVEYEEIQSSPSYSSGYALRFPRVLKLREDKPVSEISTLEQIKKLKNE